MKRETHTIDAENKVLGRLSVRIVALLRGKYRADFFPHKDMGDFVIIKNAGKVKLTGNKVEQKKYYRHSGYPGGFRETSAKRMLEKKPGEIIRKAVHGMLPKNKMRAKMMTRLRIEK